MAQFNLGGMYYDGQGVTRDYMEAYVWFSVPPRKEMKRPYLTLT